MIYLPTYYLQRLNNVQSSELTQRISPISNSIVHSYTLRATHRMIDEAKEENKRRHEAFICSQRCCCCCCCFALSLIGLILLVAIPIAIALLGIIYHIEYK